MMLMFLAYKNIIWVFSASQTDPRANTTHTIPEIAMRYIEFYQFWKFIRSCGYLMGFGVVIMPETIRDPNISLFAQYL